MWSRLINRSMTMMNKFFESHNNISNWVINNCPMLINKTQGNVNLLVLANILTKPKSNNSRH